MKNTICKLLKIKYPIIQGAMRHISNWELASACSNSGILGTIAAGSMNFSQLEHNIKKMFENTKNNFAVNIPILETNASEIAEFAIKMGVKIIITSAGNPLKIISKIKKKNIKIIHVVPSLKSAIKVKNSGIDAIICEGYEAGGHNSPFKITSFILIPTIANSINLPIIAAGGISNGQSIAAAMSLGANGVQIGTRFIATKECKVHKNYKLMITNSKDIDTCIIGGTLSPIRVIKNKFSKYLKKLETLSCNKNKLNTIIKKINNQSYIASTIGDKTKGIFQASQSSCLINNIPNVSDLIIKLSKEYKTTISNLNKKLNY